jgi:RimK family alpha-L-glutamate ligase
VKKLLLIGPSKQDQFNVDTLAANVGSLADVEIKYFDELSLDAALKLDADYLICRPRGVIAMQIFNVLRRDLKLRAKMLDGEGMDPHFSKIQQVLTFVDAGLPVPVTYWGGKCVNGPPLTEHRFPIVLKNIYGSQGHRVHLVENAQELAQFTQRYGRESILVQLPLEPLGHDYRVLVLGDRVLGMMKKVAPPGKFDSHIPAGASVHPIELERRAELCDLALQAATLCKTEFAGVDLMWTSSGPYLIEVNIPPGFRGIEQVNDVNVAEEIIKYTISAVDARRCE